MAEEYQWVSGIYKKLDGDNDVVQEFWQTGLLALCNQILHPFGFALTVSGEWKHQESGNRPRRATC